MIDRIYVVLMVGLCIVGWLYIIAKAWDWFVGITFRQWDKRRKLECQQKAVNALYDAFGLDRLEPGSRITVTAGAFLIVMCRRENKEEHHDC
ncbi:DUF4752 family protein [Salmonella enterica]|nr:DUF4752 family protein [Salmonella enterica]EDI3199354.1 DUF4752 domain-containing protein [Salmonella enterica subsp. enterica serovar Rubislaw]EHJ0481399.1 DUF4752 family protein [Salmonella enterica subsp. enterica serovar Abaetetuba]ELJ2725433.1 DUF4752 family protein [Salmonella enterica subsp. enterica]EAT6762745.1 DUF4752 family protein [Salmonella enterica]